MRESKNYCVVAWDNNAVILCDSLEQAKSTARMALAMSSSLNIFYYDQVPSDALQWVKA